MEGSTQSAITHKLPIDSQGFTQSFDSRNFDPEAVRQFYNKYGLVIFDNVINQEEIDLSIGDLWQELADMSGGKIQRNQPQSWIFHGLLGRFGFVNTKPNSQPQLWKNRSNPTIYRLFKSMYEISANQAVEQPLLALFERGSILRPSKINPDWRTESFYHFDIDPWGWTADQPDPKQRWRSENLYELFDCWLGEGNYVPRVGNHTKFQGVLALSQTNETSGGFQCVCGFQNYIKEWCRKNSSDVWIDESPELMDNMQKCYQRAGSVLIFSRQLPHNIYQNDSENFRYAQYLRMYPESTLMLTPQEKSTRKQAVAKMLPAYYDVSSQICREIYMLDT